MPLEADILSQLPYAPNDQQRAVVGALARFCQPRDPAEAVSCDRAFILNGYAGTGKTSMTGALVRALRAHRRPVVLLAPTGRAAKVFSANAGFPAHTIHRAIYHGSPDPAAGMCTALRENNMTGAVFIVDEASMIPDAAAPGAPSLLDDLLQYVFAGTDCRLLLLGDVAQLPPVGSEISPALNARVLKDKGLRVSRAQLTRTVRQRGASAILRNATWQRQAMLQPALPPPVITPGADVAFIQGEDLAEMLASRYADHGPDSAIIITRSNRRAAQFNMAVRSQVLDCDEELRRGERLMIAKNNYMWGARDRKLGIDFIANGDTATINEIYGTEMLHGFRFADVNLRLPDAGADLDCKIMLDTLVSETPGLEQERLLELANARLSLIEADNPSLGRDGSLRRLRADEYFNALQVKYAYAVTCHKAQGGQWPHVVVDMGGIDLAQPTLDFYRWLYTATTRATRRLYFLNLATQ